MYELINDIFNPANAAQVVSEITGETPREIVDVESEIIE